jgi:hypothetical protein
VVAALEAVSVVLDFFDELHADSTTIVATTAAAATRTLRRIPNPFQLELPAMPACSRQMHTVV